MTTRFRVSVRAFAAAIALVSSFAIAIVNRDCRLGLGAQGISQGGTETSKMRDSRPGGGR